MLISCFDILWIAGSATYPPDATSVRHDNGHRSDHHLICPNESRRTCDSVKSLELSQ